MKFSKIGYGIFFVCLAAFTQFSLAKTQNQDGEIIAYMEVINQAEIDAAKVAKNKPVNADTLKFADLMLDQHEKNLQQVTELSTKNSIEPNQTSSVKQFKDKGNKELEKLSKLDNAPFEKAYVAAMIKDHKQVIKMLTKFRKEAKNTDLEQYLTNTQKDVEEHLTLAKKLKV